MPFRAVVAKELAELLGVLAHPHRIRIIEELLSGECDVNTLRNMLGISHSGVSQHLTLLRAHRLVTERRQGRQVFYQLRQPYLATWLLEATQFLEADRTRAAQLQEAIAQTRLVWGRARSAPPVQHG